MSTNLIQKQDDEIPRVLDQLLRPLSDLRISVTDRCNFRCSYCMPEKDGHVYSFLPRSKNLSFEEICKIITAASSLGLKKIRLTGGEPLLRAHLFRLISMIKKENSQLHIALTTNAFLLTKQAAELKNAGLDRLTVSLDSLDEEIFYAMNGKKAQLADILQGLDAAKKAGFSSIKINCTVKAGVNDAGILSLAQYFRGSDYILRFIEYMDVGNKNDWSLKKVFTGKQIFDEINQVYPLEKIPSNYVGEVARRYRYVDGQGEIGLICSVSQPFCNSCTRLRLSADGKLYSCLFSAHGHDIREFLRAGASVDELADLIMQVWTKRTDQYSNLRSTLSSERSSKVEMYHIGG